MKREYSKPQIIFEDFALCQSIAADCSYTTNAVPSFEEVGCGIDLDPSPKETGDIVFIESISCDFVQQNGDYNRVCYHTFEEGYATLFNS